MIDLYLNDMILEMQDRFFKSIKQFRDNTCTGCDFLSKARSQVRFILMDVCFFQQSEVALNNSLSFFKENLRSFDTHVPILENH